MSLARRRPAVGHSHPREKRRHMIAVLTAITANWTSQFARTLTAHTHIDWLPSSNLVIHTQKYFLLISQSNDG